MIPSLLFIILTAAGAIRIAIGALDPHFLYGGIIYNLTLLAALAVDFFITPGPSLLRVTRFCDFRMSLGAENPVILKVRNRASHGMSIIIRDDYPYQFERKGQPLSFRLKGMEERRASYRLIPRERGDYAFGDINIRYSSRAGLFVRQFKAPSGFKVRVYPNLLELRKYHIMLRKGSLQETGLINSRIYGRGTEFERLRDYQSDDGFRSINWKATARMGRLISAEYEVERSQNIFLILDTGRLMSAQISGISRLDYAMNAALMLAYVATLKDDRAGIMVFSREIKTFIPPRKGTRQLYRIMESMYNVKSELVEPDYDKAMRFFRAQRVKRSLVVIFTELMEGESARSLTKQLLSLHPSHLPLCVTLKSQDLIDRASRIPAASQEVYERAIAAQVLSEREQTLAGLRQKGCLVLDEAPAKLSVSLVNKYLELKGKGML